MIARDLRLRSPREFERARSEGRSWSNTLLVVVVKPNGLESNRYGFAVGKRVGKAVLRNRVKRLMREAARALHPRLRQGHDVLFIARNRVNAGTTQLDIAGAMRDGLTRAGLFQEDGTDQSDVSRRQATGRTSSRAG